MQLRAALIVMCLFLGSKAEALEAVATHNLFYSADSGKGKQLLPVAELCWQINPHTLHFVTNAEKQIVAHIRTDIFLAGDSGWSRQDHYTFTTTPRTSVQDLMRHNVMELKKYTVPAGLLHVRIVLTDLADSSKPFRYSDSFLVDQPSGPFLYSGIELLDTSILSDAATPYLKMGRQLVPECTNFLDEPKRLLHFYVEAYHTDDNSQQNLPLLQKVFVSRLDNDEVVFDCQDRDTVTVLQQTHGFCGTIPIGRLQSGNYYVQAQLQNTRHEVLASQKLFFQRLNRHPDIVKLDSARRSAFEDTGIEKVTIVNLKKTFIAKYTLGEIKAILKMMLPFSDPQGVLTIKNFLKKPDETYMRYYVYNFFQAQNHDNPDQAFKEFSKKIVEVNKLYNTRTTLGYETERGFIYLRYGKPTDIVTVENEPGSLPYEIWQYNTLMQQNHKEVTDAVFLFYKPTIESYNFQLLHSSVEGEAQNQSWRNFLYKNGSSMGSDPRAEQYIGNK